MKSSKKIILKIEKKLIKGEGEMKGNWNLSFNNCQQTKSLR
jgi:hypothetical protein